MTPTDAAELATHPLLADLPTDALRLLGPHARPCYFPTGHRIFVEDRPADRFWLLGGGRVALDLHPPGRGTLVVETLGAGDLLGWSWLCPPYRWRFGATAVLPTPALEFDGRAVRDLCEEHPEVGYPLARRVLAALADRVHASRVRLLDLYGPPVRHG
jgi:CRP/FNR family cyclic AMP-dependent transcriptional regulator